MQSDFDSTLWTVIHGARRGDEKALQEFVLRYRGPVVAFAAKRVPGEAEDIAQEVFVRLIHDGVLGKADPSKGRFRSLLLAVTRRVIGHYLERSRAEKRGGGKTLRLGDIDVAAEPPDKEFDREWMAHLTQVALARLAREHPDYHKALQLFVYDGKSQEEVGKIMGVSDVKNLVFRGKKKLAEYIRDQIREYSTSQTDFDDELRLLS